ncbi:unnamed protein product [Adineta ricciae]|uniref:EGF-like domain-containing protein n=1 Tax=Adineta ricciae TaxID=249248 RepID=A0A813S371_ADIRI|nr:unnamed protein product [Adineta ricciae]CAF1492575.1 unnamed protein product [Adineta ricciae]
MMIIQWIVLVLTVVHISASKYGSLLQAEPNACANPDVAFCDFVQCENGRCVEDKASSDCFKCECSAGFTGKWCDTAVTTPSECPNGCQNGGTCEQTGTNTYACKCPAEYTGSQCETNILATHPCATMPSVVCKNGATCTINGAGYMCKCAQGWTGVNCDQQETVTQCDANTCKGHGTCVQLVGPNGPLVMCNCENRWTGKFCDVDLDSACPAGFCQNNGNCFTVGNMPYCNCSSAYTGVRCETPLGTVGPVTTVTSTTTSLPPTATNGTGVTLIPGNCANRPCSNGGSCFNTGNSFVCLCSPQWTGATCSSPNVATTTVATTPGVNPCTTNPCNNGGVCYKQGSASFVCVCPSPYGGPTCDIVKTTTAAPVTEPGSSITCANKPCENNSTCFNSGNSYFCYCGSNSKFTGKNCETPITASTSDCPLNCSPGRCIRTGSSQNAYACMCNGTLKPTSCSSN